ncbi:MAG: hypothetical protein DCF19_10095 [Pseudanabaena frigida]|uniref:DUF3047 domain-containing protein n=1 Tax=Pseudanabaena frigida TaxID=945775 RepID=A0A2W4WD25_9CYAN|nr:MAG: hypothetical protein DCF19_10095 [Pseudanabaena frigida]
MRQKYLGLGIGMGVLLAIMPPCAFAVSPASVNQDANVPWSSVIENPFDGKLVYDKHFTDDFAFVTSWSMQGIKATYTQYWSEVVGYRNIRKTRRVWHNDRYIDERYFDREPIRERRSRSQSPKALLFAVNGEIYTYTNGEVEPELAAILANAPAGNMTIRAVWRDDSTTDLPIGAGTVEAWKTIFKALPK